jgi:ABC-type lipoprotein release transport system permease subunit
MGVRMPSELKLSIEPGSLKGAVVLALTTALLGALVPALRAALLKPVDALRHT